MDRFCGDCGTLNNKDNLYCGSCGWYFGDHLFINKGTPATKEIYKKTESSYTSNIMDNIAKCYRNYAKFSGRASRTEYWTFSLYNIISTYALAFGFGVIGILVTKDESGSSLSYLAYVFVAINFMPAISVLVRRLHDVNMHSWSAIFAFIPLANIAILFMLLTKSEPDNKYGKTPTRI